MKRLLTPVLTIGLLVFAPALAQAQNSPEFSEEVRRYIEVDDAVVALTNATVVDGTGSAPMEGQTILLRGSMIEAVGPTGSVEVPEGATEMDLSGKTVIPGIIGLHNHTFYTTSSRSIQLNYSAPRLYLASGVTTVRTTGNHTPYSELNLAQAIENGEAPGPTIYTAGPYLTGGTGVSSMNRVAGPQDARRVVEYWASEGVDWFKAYTQISRDELGAAIETAHEHGLQVTAHLCSVTYQEAVSLGIDNLEHGLVANTDYYEGKEPDECPSDFRSDLKDLDVDSEEVKKTFRMMRENDVAMTSTLAVYEMYVPNRPPLEDRVLSAMSPETKQEYLETRSRIAEQAGNEDYVFSDELFRTAQAYEYAFAKSGGLLAAGVDPTGYGGALPGYGDQRNYELLLQAGFEPVEVIEIMTLNGARVLDIADRVGSIEEGKQADLVLIDGDPIGTPEEIRNVSLVFKDGVGYNPEPMIEDVQGEVGVR